MLRSTRTRAAFVAATVAGTILMSGCSLSGDEPGDSDAKSQTAARAAADWALDNLDDANLVEVTTSYEGSTSTNVDYGSSIDLVLGLSALGHAEKQAAAVTDAVAKDLVSYVGAEGEVYSGASAKALALVVDQDRDPSDFGGLDLRRRVEQTVTARGPAKGRIADKSQYGDYANTLGQAYAAAALTRVDSDLAAPVTDFLLAQQCEEGFFRLDFSDPKAPDQTCDGADVSGEQGPDVTAMVALQLAPLADEDPQIAAALDEAGEWLITRQAEDGSFSDPENDTNTNTVGLAGWALRALGEDDAADRAGAWVRDLQVSDDEEGKLGDEEGALAYDQAALEDGRTYGIADPLDRSQWVLATVQAFPALAGL